MPPCVVASLKPVNRVNYASETYESTLLWYAVEQELTKHDVEKSLEVLDAACKPLPQDQMILELGKLNTLTKQKNQNGEDIKFQMAVYGEKLSEYPADVVRKVLGTQASMSMWWPAWAELQERLELYGAKRMKMREALQKRRTAHGRVATD